jgi:hypothetical protein
MSATRGINSCITRLQSPRRQAHQAYHNPIPLTTLTSLELNINNPSNSRTIRKCLLGLEYQQVLGVLVFDGLACLQWPPFQNGHTLEVQLLEMRPSVQPRDRAVGMENFLKGGLTVGLRGPDFSAKFWDHNRCVHDPQTP